MKICMGCMEQYEDELKVCPHCGYEEGTTQENALHMTPGTILNDRYIVGKVIGYGGFGVTYIGWDALLETKIAIKEYLPGEFSTRVVGQTQITIFSGDKQEQFHDGMKKFIEEAKKLAKFHSLSGIVKIFDSFECNNTAYIVMELLEGETLAQKLKREKTIDQEQAVGMMIPILESLESVHKDGIIHRDIAPDNIFVTNSGEVKLIDFGAARYATTTHSRSLTVIIKPGYSPEEQYRSRGDQGPHTDVYAAAAALYKMITGQTPPDALERRAFFENKQKDILTPPSKLCKNIDQNYETAILNALNVRIEDRTPDMETFLHELKSEEPVKRRVGKIKKTDVLKWPLWAKIGVPAGAAALITFVVLFVTGVIGFDANLKKDIVIPEGQTRVPSVISDEYENAQSRISDAKLLMQIEGKVSSDQMPENLVLTQDVAAGILVEENTLVSVQVSAGIIKQMVANVVGYEQQEAQQKLEQLGFNVKVEQEYNLTVAKGCVISQSIPADEEVEYGSEITIVVSLGRDASVKVEEKEITVPQFVGMNYEQALEKAGEVGIQIKVSERKYSKEYKAGEIMEQTPKGGIKALNSSVVELVISLGYSKVQVPDVELMSEEQAKAQLLGRGFKVEATYENNETIAAGLVISQNPKAKTQAQAETVVKIVVSKGAEAFEMPDVLSKTQQQAVSQLKGKGLSVTVNYEQNDGKTEGEVLKQSISKGTKVKRGDNVIITVCTHSKVITVPDVTGNKEKQAKKTIENLGLKANVVEVYSESVEKGKVISQLPISGTGLKEGDMVTINVSLGKEKKENSNTQVKTTRNITKISGSSGTTTESVTTGETSVKTTAGSAETTTTTKKKTVTTTTTTTAKTTTSQTTTTAKKTTAKTTTTAAVTTKPVDEWEGYTKIYTADDFYNIQNNLSGKYVLMNDIEINLVKTGISVSYNAEDEYPNDNDANDYDFSTNTNSSKTFKGVFDGNGHTITEKFSHSIGCTDSQIFNLSVGLFYSTSYAEINNLTLRGNIDVTLSSPADAYTETYVNMSSLCAGDHKSTINNCVSYVTLNIDEASQFLPEASSSYIVYSEIGGLVGSSNSSKISNCSYLGDVRCTFTPQNTSNLDCGGIAGWMNGCTVENCINYGNISCNIVSTYRASANCGGIAGTAANGTTINNCKNYGEIYSYAETNSSKYFATSYSGGIAGYGGGSLKITNCFVDSEKIMAECNPIEITSYDSVAAAGGILGAGSATYSGCTVKCSDSKNISAKGPDKGNYKTHMDTYIGYEF